MNRWSTLGVLGLMRKDESVPTAFGPWKRAQQALIILNSLLLLAALIGYRIENARREQPVVLPSSKVGQALEASSVEWTGKFAESTPVPKSTLAPVQPGP